MLVLFQILLPTLQFLIQLLQLYICICITYSTIFLEKPASWAAHVMYKSEWIDYKNRTNIFIKCFYVYEEWYWMLKPGLLLLILSCTHISLSELSCMLFLSFIYSHVIFMHLPSFNQFNCSVLMLLSVCQLL